jgi:hypothetical protein
MWKKDRPGGSHGIEIRKPCLLLFVKCYSRPPFEARLRTGTLEQLYFGTILNLKAILDIKGGIEPSEQARDQGNSP